jgi:hypothetical protein
VVWLVYGMTRVNTGPMVAWRDTPARAVLTQLSSR